MTPAPAAAIAIGGSIDTQKPRGLSWSEARLRLQEVGPNELVPEADRESLVAWAKRVIGDPMVILLAAAASVYFAVGDTVDAVVSLIALGAITAVSVVLEARTERALARLRELADPLARVWRDGKLTQIPAVELVPGELVALREGDVVPGDGDLVGDARIKVDESSLTGESYPLDREADEHVFAGTTVLSGRAEMRLVETGARTRYGKIGTLLADIEEAPTHLQRATRRFVVALGVVALVACVVVVALELLHGASWSAATVAGISLAMAAIPEEFPMVLALYLAVGAWRLARDHALARRLAAVEALGATSVIATDKTGTLTLGRMELARVADTSGSDLAPDSEAAHDVLRAALLASEPDGADPLDRAIHRAAPSATVAAELLASYPFDPRAKYVTHVWRVGGRTRAYTKGALETILERSHLSAQERAAALATNERLAAQGMRVLGIAEGRANGECRERPRDERALRYAGLVAFADPPRPGVREALAACRDAGIRVLMMTGDHSTTASSVAAQLGLPSRVISGAALAERTDDELVSLVGEVDIFARIDAPQKHRLVTALQRRGDVVAVTGDGTNDAPALRAADIGVAMGQRGTEVARAAANLVLLDDNFTTIVRAVRDGRRIFENLRRAFAYLVAFHVPLLLVAVAVPLMGAPLLLAPVHLVWLELIVHPVSALVFEADPAPDDLMRRPPRGKAVELITPREALRPALLGITLTLGVLAVYLGTLDIGISESTARALGFVTLIVGQLFFVVATRSPDRPMWRARYAGNRMLPVIVTASVVSLLLGMYVPLVSATLGLAPLSLDQWLAVVMVAAVTTLWSEPLKRER